MAETNFSVQSETTEELLHELSKKNPWKTNESVLLSKISLLLKSEEGLAFLYEKVETFLDSGIFRGTAWENARNLVATLVKGTLYSGYPMMIYESINELRMLKIALGELTDEYITQAEARHFVQEAVIDSFELVFNNGSEEIRNKVTFANLKRIKLLFEFILKKMPASTFKDKLLQEFKEVSAHRPIITHRLRDLLRLVKHNFDWQENDDHDQELQFYIDAAFHPTALAKKNGLTEVYKQAISKLSQDALAQEATEMASKMMKTGMVSKHHIVLLRTLVENKSNLIPEALALNPHGKADYQQHQELIHRIIGDYVVKGNQGVIYSLSHVLNRNLLSRRAVRLSLDKLMSTDIDPIVKERLTRMKPRKKGLSARQLIVGGTLQLLGQPLGIGQGMNPTCQSARGLSVWSRHSPAKLLDMLVGAVTANKVSLRFHETLITSTENLDDENFDYNLDPVSVVLVPLLDNIYNQMMQQAQMRFPLEDPHVKVNPAFYGHWVPTGFASCYNTALNAIYKYNEFVRLFYIAFHPDYNHGFRLVYPLPLGIFITTATAEFLGFHAISLLRVKESPNGELRAYFFNPNNDGRQNWGQGITPTVLGNGEKHGESSLPFHELLSRVYAFHYNTIEVEAAKDSTVPKEEIAKVRKLAEESWGKKYVWK